MTTQFKMTVDTRSYVRLDSGGAVAYSEPRYDAEWNFPEGTVHMRTESDRWVYEAYRNGRRRSYGEAVKAKKARVYVWASENFNVLEDLANRRRRPYDAWKPVVEELLAKVGVEYDKLRWNQKAGCTCGCSPGFIIEGGPNGHVSFSVHLNAAPTVDESLPARDITGVTL